MSDHTYTSDLRGDARGFNRDKNSRVKWAHGQSFGPGRREEDARPRPARVVAQFKYVYHIRNGWTPADRADLHHTPVP